MPRRGLKGHGHHIEERAKCLGNSGSTFAAAARSERRSIPRSSRRSPASEYKIPTTKVHPFLCGTEGVALISADLSSQTIDTPVIAACSSRAKTSAFSFNHGAVVERVNLREQVAWCQKPGDEDTQMLAEDYLRMGIVKAQKSEPLEPLAETISKTILVIGGGVTGINAALGAAKAGYEVVLVEKSDKLGGQAAAVTQSPGRHRKPRGIDSGSVRSIPGYASSGRRK